MCAEYGVSWYGHDSARGIPHRSVQEARGPSDWGAGWCCEKVLEIQQNKNPRKHHFTDYVGKHLAESVLENRLEISSTAFDWNQCTLCHNGTADCWQFTKEQGKSAESYSNLCEVLWILHILVYITGWTPHFLLSFTSSFRSGVSQGEGFTCTFILETEW